MQYTPLSQVRERVQVGAPLPFGIHDHDHTLLLAQGQPLHHEMWMRHADGRPIWVQINAHVVDHRNRNSGVWWMLQDRTDVRTAQEALHERFEQLQATNQKLEQAQNQLLQSEKMASIGQLAAGVAHEINNPIGFVNSNLGTLRRYVESLLALTQAYARRERACPSPISDLALNTLWGFVWQVLMIKQSYQARRRTRRRTELMPKLSVSSTSSRRIPAFQGTARLPRGQRRWRRHSSPWLCSGTQSLRMRSICQDG
jgi:signal transduction histidine kinase